MPGSRQQMLIVLGKALASVGHELNNAVKDMAPEQLREQLAEVVAEIRAARPA